MCGVKKSCSQNDVESPPWIFILISGFIMEDESFHWHGVVVKLIVN